MVGVVLPPLRDAQARALNERVGRFVFPIGRHGLMYGFVELPGVSA